jgi:hypothetical protein
MINAGHHSKELGQQRSPYELRASWNAYRDDPKHSFQVHIPYCYTIFSLWAVRAFVFIA